GRYSGSTWYADNHWEELYDRCVAHVNVDCTGGRGATYYGSFPAHQELGAFGARVVREHTSQIARPRRMSRFGDMSFNGVGIPSLFVSLGKVPMGDTEADGVSLSAGRSVGGKMTWWWHTSEDTIDKIDPDILVVDTKIWVDAVWRLCHDALLPMDFRPVLADVRAELDELQGLAGAHVDLSRLQERAAVLAECVEELSDRCARAGTLEEMAALNRQMRALSRTLIPVTYTAAGRFDHDPAWDVPYLPGLQVARRLAGLDPSGDEYQYVKTQAVRNRNALSFALRRAIEVLA
ncbi:MAG: aminopeptidase, partial [Chloroflexi bacterium]|nr:aminopeptidase [Chloroflexota bacterium]